MFKHSLLTFSLGALLFCSSIANGQERKTLGVLDLDAIGISETEVRALTERLRSELIGTNRFTILERGKMDEILTEMGFQQEGCTSSECIVQAGEILGVQLMVGGSISKVGQLHSIDLRLIDVETSAILGKSTKDIKGTVEVVMMTGIREAVIGLVGGVATPIPTPGVTEPPSRLYVRKPKYWGSTTLLHKDQEIPKDFDYTWGTVSGLVFNGFCGLFPIVFLFPSSESDVYLEEQSPLYKVVWGIQFLSALYMDYALFNKNPRGVWNSWGFSIAVGITGDIIAYSHDKIIKSK